MPEFVTEIEPDILQVRLPLPFALKIVNCYAIRDSDRWCVFDTGLHTPDAEAAWKAVFSSIGLQPGQLSKIVLTHGHPDHYGMAGWLQTSLADPHATGPDALPPVLASLQEMESVRRVFQAPRNLQETIREFFSACGVPAHVGLSILGDLEKIRFATHPHPHRVAFLEPGAELRIGKRRFRIVHTPGHSDGHLIFVDTENRLVISGDHILQTITPNISQWPLAEADPLGRYLQSLSKLRDMDIRLALPGHGPLIEAWHHRITELEQHHAERLQQMLEATNGGATPYEVCRLVFEVDKLTTHEVRFAVTETLAHLEYLVRQERLTRETNGVWTYKRIT